METTNTNPSQPVPNAPQVNDLNGPTHHNKLLPIVVLVLTLFVLAGYVGYSKYKQNSLTPNIVDNSNQIENSTDTEKNDYTNMEFETYTSQGAIKYDFVYPKGAEIKQTGPINDVTYPGKETIHAVYKDLTQIITVQNGLGGLETLSSSPYEIIAGDYTSGVGRMLMDNKDPDFVTVLYLTFHDGGLQFGNMFDNKNFTFQVPRNKLGEYKNLMDILAAKTAKRELNKEIKWSPAVLANLEKSQILFSVNNKGELNQLETINTTDPWTITIASVSPTGNYLVVYYQNPNQASEKLVFYDLESGIKLSQTGMTDGTMGKWSGDSQYTFNGENGGAQTIDLGK